MSSNSLQASYKLLCQVEQADWNTQYLKNTGALGKKCFLRAGRILKYICLKDVARKFYQSDQHAGIQKISQALAEVLQSPGFSYERKQSLSNSIAEKIGQLDEKIEGRRSARAWPTIPHTYLSTPVPVVLDVLPPLLTLRPEQVKQEEPATPHAQDTPTRRRRRRADTPQQRTHHMTLRERSVTPRAQKAK